MSTTHTTTNPAVETSIRYILRGVTTASVVGYYTGRTGDGWLSTDDRDAFDFGSYLAAHRRSEQFNRMTPLHGYSFMVPTGTLAEVK